MDAFKRKEYILCEGFDCIQAYNKIYVLTTTKKDYVQKPDTR